MAFQWVFNVCANSLWVSFFQQLYFFASNMDLDTKETHFEKKVAYSDKL